MQSLKAVLWNSCRGKKLKHILENVRDGSRLLESCGNVLLKPFARKNSHSENSQVFGNAAYNFKIFTNKVFTILAVSFLLINVTWFIFCCMGEA